MLLDETGKSSVEFGIYGIPESILIDKDLIIKHLAKQFSVGKKYKEVEINGEDIDPMVTWGTSPQDVVPVTGFVPDPTKEKNENHILIFYSAKVCVLLCIINICR